MKSFIDVMKAYGEWKLKEGNGNEKVSKEEIRIIREAYRRELSAKTPEKKEMPKQLREACDSLSKWKKDNGRDEKLTKEEFGKLKEDLKEKNKQDFARYISNFKKVKEALNQPGTVSKSEYKHLKDNFVNSLRKGTKIDECQENFDLDKAVKKVLREADMGMDPAAAGGAPMAGDPNAMAGGDPNAAMPGAGAPADPMALQGAVDAAIAALQPVATGGGNALGADPNAGLPPVDGSGAPAAGPAPGAAPNLMEATNLLINWKKANGKGESLTEGEKKMLEAKYGAKKTKYDELQERIAAREAKIMGLQEGSVQDSQKKIDAGKGYPTPESNSHGGDHTVTEEQVVVPSAQKLANGYSSGKAAGETAPAKTWPTKAIGKEAGGALQGAGATQTKMKESTADDADPTKGVEENEETAQTIINETKTVTDIYVDRHLEEHLDFQKIKEAMSSGLLG